jgi:hypothetical protein
VGREAVAVKTWALVTLYLSAIVVANLSVTEWGPRAAVYNAFLFIGLDLVSRDRLHSAWEGRWLWPKMGLLIAAGSLLSYALGLALGQGPLAGRIAFASCLAFAVAATVDAVVYQVAHGWAWFERSNLSNIFGAGADSLVFQTTAFGFSFPFIFAQFCAKVAGGLVWSFLLKRSPRDEWLDRHPYARGRPVS